MSDDTRQLRIILIALCAVIAMFTSCTANNFYQERAVKEAALARGLNATQAACIWNNRNTVCAVVAAQGK